MSATPSRWLGILLFGAVAACGGGGSGPATPPAPVPTFAVTATVNGLTGSGLTLVNNSGAPIPVSADGTVTIASAATSGSTYNVTVQTQPTASPAQACRVVAGTGTVAASNVSSIVVECRPLIGKFVYVASRVGINTANPLQIYGYRIDSTTGRLLDISGFPVTPPVSGFFANPIVFIDQLMIVASPDERHLVAYRSKHGQGPGGVSNDTGGILTSYRIDAVTGQLTEMSSLAMAQGRGAISSLTMHPNGRHIALMSASVNDSGVYIDAPVLMLVDLDPVTGTLSTVAGATAIALPSFNPGQFGPSATPLMRGSPTFNPTGSAIYMMLSFGRRSLALATFTQGAPGAAPYVADGWQAVQGPEPGSAPETELQSGSALTVSPNGRRLAAAGGYYTTDTNNFLGNITSLSATLATMNLDATTGTVTSRSAPDFTCSGCWPSPLSFAPDSQSVFMINPGYRTGVPSNPQNPGASNAGPALFYPFTLDANGIPTLVSGAPFSIGQDGVYSFSRIHPFAPRVYFPVAGTGQGGGIAIMQQGAGGAWSPLEPMAAPGAAASMIDVQIDSSGRYLIASDPGQDLVHSYAIDQTSGQLSFQNSLPSQVDPGQIVLVGTQMMP